MRVTRRAVTLLSAAAVLLGALLAAAPAQAHDVTATNLAAVKADAIALAPAGSAAVVETVKDLGGGAIQIDTKARPLSGFHSEYARGMAALHVTGPFYTQHENHGWCFGYWHGDSLLVNSSGGTEAYLRTMYSGPSYENKKCAAVVEFPVANSGYTKYMAVKIVSSYDAAVVAGPACAGADCSTPFFPWYIGPVWTPPNHTGCYVAHGARQGAASTQYLATYRLMDC